MLRAISVFLICVSFLAGCIEEDLNPFAETGSCSACEIELKDVATIRFDDSPAAPAGSFTMAATSDRSRYVVAFGGRNPVLAEFDGTAAFMRVIERAGDGPGEFRQITAIAFHGGDSLWVFDAGARRITVLSPRLEFARSFAFNGRIHGVGAVASGWVAEAEFYEGGAGRSLIHLDFDGRVSELERGRREVEDRHTVAGLAGDGLLSVDRDAYLLRRWNMAAGTVDSMARMPAWMQGPRPHESVLRFIELEPQVFDISAVDSVLWVLGVAVDETLADIPELPDRELSLRELREYGVPDPEELRELVYPVIEALSRSDGRLLAQRFAGHPPMYFLAPGLVQWPVYDDDGVPVIHVHQLRLVRPPS